MRSVDDPISLVPDWFGFSNGFVFEYDVDPSTGKVGSATRDHERILDEFVADYVKRLTVVQHREFPARIFQRAFHLGLDTTLPKLRTVQKFVQEAKDLPHSPEFDLVLDVLHGMFLGDLPGPLAWQSNLVTQRVFAMIHECWFKRNPPDRTSADWLWMVRSAFGRDYVEWLDLHCDDREEPASNVRPVADAQTLGDYLKNRRGSE